MDVITFDLYLPSSGTAALHACHGEAPLTSWRVPMAEATSPSTHVAVISCQPTRVVILVEYSSGWRIARYWSSPATEERLHYYSMW